MRSMQNEAALLDSWSAYVLTQINVSANGQRRPPQLSSAGAGCEERSGFFKVLPGMRHGNAGEYDPTMFSFGPYHATLALPVPLGDHYKIQAAIAQLPSAHSFEALVAKIQQNDPHIKSLYAAHAWNESDAALRARLLALDALMLVSPPCLFEELRLPHTLFSIVSHDALLLENQIPLWVLQAAIDSIIEAHRQPDPLETSVDIITSAAPDVGPDVPRHTIEKVMHMHLRNCGYPFQSHLHKFMPAKMPQGTHYYSNMLSYIYHTLILGNLPGDTAMEIPEDLSHHSHDGQYPVMGGLGQIERQDLLPAYFPSTSAAKILQGAAADYPGVMHLLGHDSDLHQTGFMESASALRMHGITFVGKPDCGFQEVSYKNRVLTLPELTMYGNTKSLLLNLLAYEATSGANRLYHVTCYVVLMNDLLQSEEDLGVLVDCGAIVLSREYSRAQFVSMWKTLIHKLPFIATDKFVQMTKDIKRDCRRKCYRWSAAACGFRVHKWSAVFVERYWEKQPWLLLSIITALFLLVLTCLQTVYTVLQYRAG